MPFSRHLQNEQHPDSKSNLFAVFTERLLRLVKPEGYTGLMTPFTWMFISSYEHLRRCIVETNTLLSLIQPDYHAFFESAYFPICSFVIQVSNIKRRADFIRLTQFYGEEVQPIKTLEAIRNQACGWRYTVYTGDFGKIPGSPVAYWASDKISDVFQKSTRLKEYAEPRQGMATADNHRFLRRWHEIDIEAIGFGLSDREAANNSGKKWFPYNKGGEFRRWYGNNDFVVNWESDGYEIRNFFDANGKVRSHPQNMEYFFKPCVTWSFVNSSSFAARRSDQGFLFDVGGSSAFPNPGMLILIAGFLCSNLALHCMRLMNPTLNFQVGNVAALPLHLEMLEPHRETINNVVENAVSISRLDWNSSETAWDLSCLPLLLQGIGPGQIATTWKSLWDQLHARRRQLAELERENNRLFIEAYGLQDELSHHLRRPFWAILPTRWPRSQWS